MLNPIEMAWSGLKNFVRKHSTSFRLSDVRRLATQWIFVLTPDDSIAYIDHILKIVEIFKKSDRFIEQDIIDEADDDMNSQEEGTIDWYSNVFLHILSYFKPNDSQWIPI